MRKLPNKMMAVSTFLTILTANTVAPISALASETKQTAINQEENTSTLSADPKGAKTSLEKAQTFAKVMNNYSRLLIHSPDIDFEGIEINNYENLPDTIKNDQTNARKNAIQWDTVLKKELLQTLSNITNYSETFQAYYADLLKAAKDKNYEELTEGLQDLLIDIKDHKGQAEELLQNLKTFKGKLGEDVRAFQTNKNNLEAVLKSQDSKIERQQKIIEEFNKALSSPIPKDEAELLIKYIAGIFSPVSAVMNTVELSKYKDKLKELEKLNKDLNQEQRVKLIVTNAFSSTNNMHKSISNAIESIQYMYDMWNGLDIQFGQVITDIGKVSDKVTSKRLAFLSNSLKVANKDWENLYKDAVETQEGIKELTLEPINPS